MSEEARGRAVAAHRRDGQAGLSRRVRRRVGRGREGARGAAALQHRARDVRGRPRRSTPTTSAHARTLLRWATESQKPNGDRLPEYTDVAQAADRTAARLGRADLSRAREGAADRVARADARQARRRSRAGQADPRRQDAGGARRRARRARRSSAIRRCARQLFAGGAAAVERVEGSVHRARAPDRAARARAAQEVRRRSAGGRARCLREDRAGGVRDAGRVGVSGRDVHAAAVVRRGEGLHRQRQARRAVHADSAASTSAPTSTA